MLIFQVLHTPLPLISFPTPPPATISLLCSIGYFLQRPKWTVYVYNWMTKSKTLTDQPRNKTTIRKLIILIHLCVEKNRQFDVDPIQHVLQVTHLYVW